MSSTSVAFRTNGTSKPTYTNTKRVDPLLVEEIVKALHTVTGYGSIEIYIQDHQVTQITVRTIKKTRHTLVE
jgi:hypothetical protein